jgi:hypothetical protein
MEALFGPVLIAGFVARFRTLLAPGSHQCFVAAKKRNRARAATVT